MIFLNKKATTMGTTLTWVFAIFLILMILTGFFIFATYLYKSKGSSNDSLTSEYSGVDSAALYSFLNILKKPSKEGKSIVEDIVARDRSSFQKQIVDKKREIKDELGVDCFSSALYFDDILMAFTGYVGGGRGYSEDKYVNIYLRMNKDSIARIKFYGGKCLG
jgi:hypothetical protein